MTFDPLTSTRRFPDATTPTVPEGRGPVPGIVAAVRDSATGLATAAGLVSTGSWGDLLADLADARRHDAVALANVVAETGPIDALSVPSGTLEALRRGWMRVEAALASDTDVMTTVVAQEQRLTDLLEEAAGQDLPDDIEARIRATHVGVLDGLEALSGAR